MLCTTSLKVVFAVVLQLENKRGFYWKYSQERKMVETVLLQEKWKVFVLFIRFG